MSIAFLSMVEYWFRRFVRIAKHLIRDVIRYWLPCYVAIVCSGLFGLSDSEQLFVGIVVFVFGWRNYLNGKQLEYRIEALECILYPMEELYDVKRGN